MLKLPHFRIVRFTPTKIGTNITIEILSEDLPRDTRDILETLWKDGNPIAGMIQEIAKEKEVEEGKGPLVSTLHMFMQKYCEKKSMNFEVYNKKFKSDYGVERKNEMSRDDLSREIERHKAGLTYE